MADETPKSPAPGPGGQGKSPEGSGGGPGKSPEGPASGGGPGAPPRPATPPATPRPTTVDEPARDLGRRLRVWLGLLTLVALLAAGAAGYAISEIESAKDENREDDQAVSALRADLDVMREQLGERLDALERRADDAAEAQALQKAEDGLDALQKRVARLDREDDGGESDEITTRVDDLEQRIEELENDNNN